MRIIYCRQAKQWALKCRIAQHEWDSKECKVILPRYDKERAEQLRKISGKLVHHASMLREVVKELTHSGKDFDVKEIYRSYLLYDSEHSVRGYTRRMTEEMDKNGQSRSAYAYRGVAQAFINFCGGDLLLDSINTSLICGFENSIKQRGWAAARTPYRITCAYCVLYATGLAARDG